MKKLKLHLKKMHVKCINLCTFKWASVYCNAWYMPLLLVL